MADEIVIDESNFSQYFRDARKTRPRKGEVLAKFTAVAEFVGGRAKKDIIGLLKMNKAPQAAQIMQKIHGAQEPDCYRVCREMAEDLLRLSEDEVENKPYEYVVHYLFYTKKEYIPNNSHWETLPVLEVEFDKETGRYKTKIEI
jgi:hypothetical protein